MVAGAAPVISRDIARGFAEGLTADYNRFPTSAASAATFKQWVHVAVLDPAIALIANFSAMPATAGMAHRLVVLVRTGELRGQVREVPAELCAMPAGRTALRFGGNELTTTGEVHRLTLDEPDLALRARLTLREVARRAVLRHRPLGARGAFHWAVAPRLVATGMLEYAGNRHALLDAPAYRDRNWGAFCFGDVAWDWGYATAGPDGPPCAIAFARVMDASRTRVVEQQVLVWWGDALLASFRDREVELACAGAFDGPLVTVPPALALCRSGRATGVPRTVTAIGSSSRGRVELRFDREATARIIVPNESRLGTTAIYESLGGVAVTGRVDGQDLGFGGRGLFECVHA
jgi:hypothetical protein